MKESGLELFLGCLASGAITLFLMLTTYNVYQ